MLRDLLDKHGIGAKFVRAYCKAMGWRYTAQGAPEQWYAVWRSGLAADVAALLAARGEIPGRAG